ncbi:MAG TPA: hypothetical protein VJ866_08195 [Pyrinomonadaceae bacterium]|nr:hypothetical protein [Pyrinomonadaceae bacterium]
MNRKFMVFTLAAALLANTVAAAAQERERTRVVVEPVQQEEVFIAQGPGEAPPAPGGDSIVYMATEMSFAGKLVKGAPYSAQAVTESIQTLADGNRIVRKNTAQVYRDSEGRTRRDQTFSNLGPYSTGSDVPQAVFINDPVAAVNYILDPASKTARKFPRLELRFKTEGGDAKADSSGAEVRRKIEVERTFTRVVPGPEAPPAQTGTAIIVAPPAGPVEGGGPVEFHLSRSSSKAETKSEKLEPRSFDGVMAEGTRTTTTIPAGELGNEQPIQIVSERWYSPELQVVVMTRHSDPRTGETTYRLTNLSRTEPAASLFQVPADYTLKEAPAPGVRRMRRPNTAPPAPQEN